MTDLPAFLAFDPLARKIVETLESTPGQYRTATAICFHLGLDGPHDLGSVTQILGQLVGLGFVVQRDPNDPMSEPWFRRGTL